jgi:hypothetical protein
MMRLRIMRRVAVGNVVNLSNFQPDGVVELEVEFDAPTLLAAAGRRRPSCPTS